MDSDKKKALELALGKIEKDFGKGSLMRLGDKPDEKIPVIPTGALSLDVALGIGGVPRGRIIEIYGAESSGKTTIALHIIAEAQKQGGVAAFIDAEHALDPTYAAAIGVNTDDLLVSQPDKLVLILMIYLFLNQITGKQLWKLQKHLLEVVLLM